MNEWIDRKHLEDEKLQILSNGKCQRTYLAALEEVILQPIEPDQVVWIVRTLLHLGVGQQPRHFASGGLTRSSTRSHTRPMKSGLVIEANHRSGKTCIGKVIAQGMKSFKRHSDLLSAIIALSVTLY